MRIGRTAFGYWAAPLAYCRRCGVQVTVRTLAGTLMCRACRDEIEALKRRYPFPAEQR